ncbi:hypothetical protein [Fibrisoma montanum]|nr:hypothetical protein [Fibrisoma montanum]
MKIFRLFCLFIFLSFIFSACSLNNLLDPIDYPPSSSKLKGPKQADLATQPFTLTKIVDFPFRSSVRQFGSRYLLSGYAGQEARYALVEAGSITEIASKPLRELFLNQAGGIWGITVNGTQETVSQFVNGRWQDYAVLLDDGYFYGVVDIKPTEFRFATSKGTMVWDVPQKTVKQIITAERARFLTKNYSIGLDGENITVFDNQAQNLLASWELRDYVSIKKGISNDIWGAFEDDQRNLWMVVKDGNWDGVLLKYDGSTLRKLSLIPVGYYDSGRYVSNFNTDNKGNLWLNVDGTNYIYTKAGQWILPQFGSIKNNYQPRVFSDGQGNLTLTESSALYSIDQ